MDRMLSHGKPIFNFLRNSTPKLFSTVAKQLCLPTSNVQGF